MRTRPSGVGKPPSANGASGIGRLIQPGEAFSASKVTAPRSVCAASVSSLSRKHGSSKPIAAARRRKISVLGSAWPSGEIAGSFSSTSVWP